MHFFHPLRLLISQEFSIQYVYFMPYIYYFLKKFSTVNGKVPYFAQNSLIFAYIYPGAFLALVKVVISQWYFSQEMGIGKKS